MFITSLAKGVLKVFFLVSFNNIPYKVFVILSVKEQRI